MIEIRDSDFYSLEDFPLRWRWTDERWNKLPSDCLEQINPLVDSKADEILRIQNQYFLNDDFESALFEKEESIRTELLEFSVIQEWLKNRIGDTSENIFVVWDKETAVRTNTQIFCNYWNDFCYPASDDISVSTANLNWLLNYHHDERFVFGNVKKEFIR